MIVGVPLPIPASDLADLPGVVSVERMLSQHCHPTRAVPCTFASTVPNEVDIGLFGKYPNGQYTPEPL